MTVEIRFDLNNPADYETFIKVKSLPRCRFVGRTALIPDEYADRLGIPDAPSIPTAEYCPILGLFDYQEAVTKLAIRKRKFAVFMDCGLGKTLCFLEYARHVASILPENRAVLIVSPLMVVSQTLAECERFYGRILEIEQVKARDLSAWLTGDDPTAARIGITNYDALSESTPQGRIGCLILDESSMLKSAYGKWGQQCLRLGAGLDYKLCLTGTPAPNDRIEYANHAVFLDAFPTVNSFLAKFFINRGQTDNRWEIKPHAIGPFYRALSDWSIFLANPATYGFRHNAGDLPPINVHVHDIDMTVAQNSAVQAETGGLFANHVGGIASRSVLSRIAKGSYRGSDLETGKPAFIRDLVASWSDGPAAESTIIWCLYNDEQAALERLFPEAASIEGATPYERRAELIDDFKSGRRRVMISKPKVLGFGLNLQICTRQVFSGLQDSYESYYQAVKRSNRYGSTKPLNVHLPVTEVERPMVETVLRKAARVQQDTNEQERIFKDACLGSL